MSIPSDLGTPQLQQFLGPQPPDWDSPPPTPVLGSILGGLPKTTEPVVRTKLPVSSGKVCRTVFTAKLQSYRSVNVSSA